jgi:hypothetical protein
MGEVVVGVYEYTWEGFGKVLVVMVVTERCVGWVHSKIWWEACNAWGLFRDTVALVKWGMSPG